MESLASFRNRHQGETILVCGCGSSLNQLEQPEQFLTIGVNDVGRRFQPDYLVVVNPRGQFKGDRFRYVETSKAKNVFTQLDLRLGLPGVVKFRLGQYGGTDLSDPEVLHYTRNSPYVAVCLAALMGAKRIGLIGVDFTDHHFFANTGRHPLTGSMERINEEYKKIAAALAARGIELVNLSFQSRLTSLPKQELATFSASHPNVIHGAKPPVCNEGKVFFVHYQFLSCGDVFRKGIMHAAADLKLNSDEAYWDDPNLAEKVTRFNPDLLFVVHGRRFSHRWNGFSKRYPSAVWLLDEPYEVDDTATFSRAYQWTFVNDPSTLARHQNAHYLPTCFDPHLHFHSHGPRAHRVGFIGGANPRRERWLAALAEQGLLDYIVGGPWQIPPLNRVCQGRNIPEERTAELYRQTRIVVNIFRQQHHYNGQRLPATSLNPRLYESLACGALPVTEPRPELERVCPQMPVFKDESELTEIVAKLIADEPRRTELQRLCAHQLRGHTYADRLRDALTICGLESRRQEPSPKGPSNSARNQAPVTWVHRIQALP